MRSRLPLVSAAMGSHLPLASLLTKAMWSGYTRSRDAPVMLTFPALFGCADPDVRVDMETFLNKVVPEVRPGGPPGRNLS
jgi:hypothetical protein